MWAAKHWREYHRINKLPPLHGSNKADVSASESIKNLVADPLCVQFRPDGSVIPLEEIIRCFLYYSNVYSNIIVQEQQVESQKSSDC